MPIILFSINPIYCQWHLLFIICLTSIQNYLFYLLLIHRLSNLLIFYQFSYLISNSITFPSPLSLSPFTYFYSTYFIYIPYYYIGSVLRENMPDKKNGVTKQTMSFQNLEPINYIKTFNKMLQLMAKPSHQSQSTNQLKIVKLSKFPLHQYYQDMEGVVQGHHKKHNQNHKINKKQLQLNQIESKFVNKHHLFLKQALNKIIQDNQIQQTLLIKSKNFHLSNTLNRNSTQYHNQILKLVKLKSQPKLSSLKKNIHPSKQSLLSIKTLRNLNSSKTIQTHRTRFQNNQNNKLSQFPHQSHSLHHKNYNHQQKTNQNIKTLKTQHSILNKNETSSEHKKHTNNTLNSQEHYHNPIFKKLTPPEQISKFSKRNHHQINLLLNQRKTFKNNQPASLTERIIYPITQKKIFQVKQKRAESQTIKDIHLNHSKQIKTFNDIYFNNSKQNKTIKENTLNHSKQSKMLNKKPLNNIQSLSQILKHKKGVDFQLPNQLTNDHSIDGKNKHQSTPIKGQDPQEKFQKQVQILQKQQALTQTKFASKIQQKIKQINQKLNKRIEQVKIFDCSINSFTKKLPKIQE